MISNFAKLYYYRHITQRLGLTAVWYDICEQYPCGDNVSSQPPYHTAVGFSSFSKNRNFFVQIQMEINFI
jgi:hypothetical protein